MGGGKGLCKECKGVKVEEKEREGGKGRGRGGREGRVHEITASYNFNYNDCLSLARNQCRVSLCICSSHEQYQTGTI